MKLSELKVGSKFKFAPDQGVNDWTIYEIDISNWRRILKTSVYQFNIYPEYNNKNVILESECGKLDHNIAQFKDLPVGTHALSLATGIRFVKGYNLDRIYPDWSIRENCDPGGLCKILGKMIMVRQ